MRLTEKMKNTIRYQPASVCPVAEYTSSPFLNPDSTKRYLGRLKNISSTSLCVTRCFTKSLTETSGSQIQSSIYMVEIGRIFPQISTLQESVCVAAVAANDYRVEIDNVDFGTPQRDVIAIFTLAKRLANDRNITTLIRYSDSLPHFDIFVKFCETLHLNHAQLHLNLNPSC